MITAKNNPFATDRVLQIRYTPQTCTWDELLARLEAMHYRAAIIGADGTGKTTLIEDIARRLAEQGLSCRSIFVTMDVLAPLGKIDEILAGMTEVAEGVRTTRAAVELARRHGVEMPIAAAVHAVLEGELDVRELPERLMRRQLRPENE